MAYQPLWVDVLPNPVFYIYIYIYMCVCVCVCVCVLYSHMQYHNDTIIKDEWRLLYKICTSHFIVRVRKGLLVVFVREGAGDRTETAIFWPLLLWPSTLCLSRSTGLLNRRPRGPLCWMMAFFTASYQHLLWTPIQSEAPSPFGLVWLSLPHLVYNSVRSLTVISVLKESYNSSTPTQSPTRSLEWRLIVIKRK